MVSNISVPSNQHFRKLSGPGICTLADIVIKPSGCNLALMADYCRPGRECRGKSATAAYNIFTPLGGFFSGHWCASSSAANSANDSAAPTILRQSTQPDNQCPSL